MSTESLLGKTLDEIFETVYRLNGDKILALEISKYIYRKNALNFTEMLKVPLALRKALDANYNIDRYCPISVGEANDKTRKYLFENNQSQKFETVYMPGQKRNTLCISTQSGCRMGCRFCVTGKIDFRGNLLAKDIINQYLSIPEQKKVNRIVIMGMGEPFDNFIEVKKAVEILTAQWGVSFGASNITISTVGLVAPLREFLENPFCNLAISLNNPFSNERKVIMPIEITNAIAEVIDLIRVNPLKKPLRVSFEYVALGGINTDEVHAKGITRLLNGINCHLNIIPWNSHDGTVYKSPSEIELNTFISCLNNNGVLTAVRHSRGQDIGAACGQMAGKAKI